MKMNARSYPCFGSLLVLVAGTMSSITGAQPIEPVEPQERAIKLQAPPEQHTQQLAQAVLDRINASFLTQQERDQLRVIHGQWTPQDLANPEFVSAHAPDIALDLGDLNNPLFDNEETLVIKRAWAHFGRGNYESALELIEEIQEQTIESQYLKASLLELAGQFEGAIRELESIETKLTQSQLTDINDLAYGSEALIKLTQLRSPAVSARADYDAINELISYARDRVDRLNWRIRSVEAKLLYEHHNLADAYTAALEAIRLNPRAIEPMLLLGHIAVDGFDFDNAEKIALGIDQLGSALTTDTTQEENNDADERNAVDIDPAVSPGGAIIRARIALRRRDPLGAEQALDPALARYPNHPTLLALQASAAAAGYRISSTNRLLERFDDRFPNSSLGSLWVGRTLSDARQYEEAAEFLQDAIDLSPHWGEPRLQLGLMLVQAGKDQQARQALNDAMKLDPFNIRAQNSLKLLTELATYEIIETEHFIIRYKAGPDEILAQEMPEILEQIHERVCADIPGGMAHEPDQKTIIELMPNHEWFAVRIGGMPSIHTMAASTGPVIAFESPRDGPKSKVGPYDWPRVLQHEYTHTVNLSRTRNRVIHWMTEANAVFNEDAPRDQSQWSLLTGAYNSGTLFDLDEINTAFVRPKKPTDRSLAYAQGAWMFEFIVERFGPQAPRDIMDASTTGRTAPQAFQQVLDLDQSEFISAFKEWAGQDLRSRGLLLPQELPSLEELLGNPGANAPQQGLPAISKLDELLDQYPDHPDLLNLRLGMALAKQGEQLNQEQISLLQQAIVVRPVDEMPHKRLARYYLSTESLEDRARAIPHLEFLDNREVHTTAYADQLVELYAQNGELEYAQTKAIRTTQIDPFNPRPREQAARIALLRNDLDTAEHHLTALTRIEPDRAIHNRRLEALQSMRDGSN
ncbi:MAG: tetratricopeptide repeat protein [Phycisphaerales bacterium]